MDFTGGDVLSAGLGAVGTIYNMYTNKRDFDYQKALQQQIFEREDTAVQRRMADLKAAGINPNLAAGSAASAGAVVGRSQTNDVNMGAALDMLQAANSIKQQKQQTKNLQIEQQILNEKAIQEAANATVSKMDMFNALGLPYGIRLKQDGNKMVYDFVYNSNSKATNQDMPYNSLFNYQMQNMKNSADLLQKDVDWYTADKVSGMALGALGLGNSFSNWKKLFSK